MKISNKISNILEKIIVALPVLFYILLPNFIEKCTFDDVNVFLILTIICGIIVLLKFRISKIFLFVKVIFSVYLGVFFIKASLICSIMCWLYSFCAFLCFYNFEGKKGDTKLSDNTVLLTQENIGKLKEYLISANEKIICTLGNGYIINLLSNGIFKRGYSIITDKRVYFKGECYYNDGKSLKKVNEERTVDLEDIRGSGFIFHKSVAGGILTILFAVITVLFAGFCIYDIFPYDNNQIESNISEVLFTNSLITILTVAFCSIIWLCYELNKKTLFEISFAGGKICFDVQLYSKSEINDFQKQLRLAKDSVKSEAAVIKTTESVASVTKIRCSKCGSLQDENAKFCDVCGTKILKVSVCKCGYENKPHAGYCANCGEKLGNSN